MCGAGARSSWYSDVECYVDTASGQLGSQVAGVQVCSTDSECAYCEGECADSARLESNRACVCVYTHIHDLNVRGREETVKETERVDVCLKYIHTCYV